jgi:hypothetical protein
MRSNELVESKATAADGRSSHSRFKYKKVMDGRKQPIRGLWERNGKLIARIAVEDSDGMYDTHALGDAGRRGNGSPGGGG